MSTDGPVVAATPKGDGPRPQARLARRCACKTKRGAVHVGATEVNPACRFFPDHLITLSTFFSSDKNLCRCFGAPACRVFPDHLITLSISSLPTRTSADAARVRRFRPNMRDSCLVGSCRAAAARPLSRRRVSRAGDDARPPGSPACRPAPLWRSPRWCWPCPRPTRRPPCVGPSSTQHSLRHVHRPRPRRCP